MHVLVVKSHIWRFSLFVTWCSAFNSVWLQLMCHFLFCSYAFLGVFVCFIQEVWFKAERVRLCCAFCCCQDQLQCLLWGALIAFCAVVVIPNSTWNQNSTFSPEKEKWDLDAEMCLRPPPQRLWATPKDSQCVQMSLWSRGCLLLQLVWFWSAACSFSSSLSRSLSMVVHNHHLTFFSAGLWRKAVNWASLSGPLQAFRLILRVLTFQHRLHTHIHFFFLHFQEFKFSRVHFSWCLMLSEARFLAVLLLNSNNVCSIEGKKQQQKTKQKKLFRCEDRPSSPDNTF